MKADKTEPKYGYLVLKYTPQLHRQVLLHRFLGIIQE